jgi:hypothetical protein
MRSLVSPAHPSSPGAEVAEFTQNRRRLRHDRVDECLPSASYTQNVQLVARHSDRSVKLATARRTAARCAQHASGVARVCDVSTV